MKRTLIRGGQVYDHDGDVHKPAMADILIEDDSDRGGRRRHSPRMTWTRLSKRPGGWSCPA